MVIAENDGRAHGSRNAVRSAQGRFAAFSGKWLGHEQAMAQQPRRAMTPAALPAQPDEPEQHVHIVDERGRLVWSSTNHGRATPLHLTLAEIWPQGITKRIESAVRSGSAAASMRFVAATGQAQDRRWWDVLMAPVAGGAPDSPQYVVTARDVTRERKDKATFRDAAVHDQLTGLLNRTQFLLEIEKGIARAPEALPFAVVKFDIDAFRHQNDVFGQSRGDAILKAFARRLMRRVRGRDAVARIGGDEFGIILWDVADAPAGEIAARRLMARLARPLRIEDDRVSCTVSAGLAMFPAQGRCVDDLCRSAGAALTVARSAGRGTLICAKPEMSHAIDERERMLELAAVALNTGRIVPYYQPKIDLQTGIVVGFEALLRWRSSEGRLGMPGEIWAAFSDPTLSCRITDVIIRHVIADVVRWQRQGVAPCVAINVTDADLRRPRFAEGLLAQLGAANVPTSQIEIEVTENVFVGRDPDDMLATLGTLREAGVRIAFDDFGTGHASLVHLRQFSPDVLKIDRSFIANMSADPGDRAIVEGILGLAAALSMEVVAEGVELSEHADFLASRGCGLGQGFLFGEAVKASTVPATMIQPMSWCRGGHTRKRLVSV